MIHLPAYRGGVGQRSAQLGSEVLHSASGKFRPFDDLPVVELKELNRLEVSSEADPVPEVTLHS